MTDQADPAPAWEPTEEQMRAYLTHRYPNEVGRRRHADIKWNAPWDVVSVKAARAAVFGPEIEAMKARAEKAEADRAELLEKLKEVHEEHASARTPPWPSGFVCLDDAFFDSITATIAKVEGRQ